MTFRSLRPESVHGRQAEARRNDLVVLEAARDVFTAQGANAPVAAVAERAGVGMGTLYRRYGSKTDLLQRLCVLAMEQALQAAADALRAGDPWTGLAGDVRTCVELRSGALAALAGQIETTAEMHAVARRSMARLAEIVARAHRDGSLRPDVTALDITWLIEQFGRRAPDPVRAGRGAQRPRAAGGHRPGRAARPGRRPRPPGPPRLPSPSGPSSPSGSPSPSRPPAQPRPLRAPLVPHVISEPAAGPAFEWLIAAGPAFEWLIAALRAASKP